MREIYCLFLLLQLPQRSDGAVHSISGFFIGSQGLDLPDYMERIAVDDVTMYYYDSSMNTEVPCPEWLNTTEGQQHWKDINLISHHNKHTMTTALQSAIQQFNLTDFDLVPSIDAEEVCLFVSSVFTATSSDVNIYQGFSRCDLYPDGTLKAMLTHAFNGKDFITLDIDSKTYTASVPQAIVYKRQREANPVLLEITVAFYKRTCFERLKMFLQHAPRVNMKKVPEVSLFERTKAGSKVLTCHVTGFYPRDVQVEWVGAGLQFVDEEMVDVLPNGDGTYQTRRSVIRPEENPEEHKYSCVVHHSSVAGDITKTWVTDEHSRLAVWISLICVFLAIIGAGLLLRRFCKNKGAGI